MYYYLQTFISVNVDAANVPEVTQDIPQGGKTGNAVKA